MPLVHTINAIGKVGFALPNDYRGIFCTDERGNLVFSTLRACWEACEAGGYI